MKQITFLCFLFFVTSVSFAQETDSIDFQLAVKYVVTDSMSQFFYPRLIEKVKNNPVDITEKDCYYLYYGQIFQPTYKPIGLSFLRNPEYKDFEKAAMNGNCKKVIVLGKIMLERTPVDLTVLLHTSVCIRKQKKYTDTDYFPQRFENLLSAIFSTGDGKTKETAIKIVSVEDDYVLKGILGFLGGQEKLMSDNNRVYSVWERGSAKLYFEDIMNVENMK